MKLKVILVTIFLLASCAKADLVGKWVEPIPGMESQMQGFNFEKDGKASSINMNTLLYESWRREGDKLFLTGKSLGNGQTINFHEEYIISTLNEKTLILKDGDIEFIYTRQTK